MQPKQDPETLELRARPRAVTRLNRRVILLATGLLAVIVIAVLMWGAMRPAKTLNAAPTTPGSIDRVTRAEGVNALPRDYASIPKVPRLGPPIGELARPVLNAERQAGTPELPQASNFKPDPEEDAARARRLKEQTEADEAAKAAIVYRLKRSEAAGAAATPSVQSSDLGGPQISADPKRSEAKRFVNRETRDRIYATGTPEKPRSPFELLAGTVISAALITGIKSDLPGSVTATVTEDVFDSVHGKSLLIPQGARLLGQYDSAVAYGQRRVLLVWTRLLMPDGSSIILDRLSATDPQGYAGLEDGVDWHWKRIFAGAAVSTLLGAAAELAAPDREAGNGSVIVTTRQGAQDTINQVGQEITRRNLDIQPTLTARSGLPLKVVINRDLVLAPYGES